MEEEMVKKKNNMKIYIKLLSLKKIKILHQMRIMSQKKQEIHSEI